MALKKLIPADAPHQPVPEKIEPPPEVKQMEEGVDSEVVSARLCAESAITEFQKASDTMSLEEARKAYARLMIGRGFDRMKRTAAEVKPKADSSSTPSEPEGTGGKGE